MDSIDASIIGLYPTLQLLQQYFQSGILQADISSFAYMRGPCIIYITVVEGNITTCYIQDKTGKRQSVEIATLLQMDMDKGPLAWRFHPQQNKPPEKPASLPVPTHSQSQPPTQPLTPYTIPRRIAKLDLSWITTWSPQQKRTLRMVYSMIDGHRSVATIERSIPLPNAVIQEALIVLIAMHIITVDS